MERLADCGMQQRQLCNIVFAELPWLSRYNKSALLIMLSNTSQAHDSGVKHGAHGITVFWWSDCFVCNAAVSTGLPRHVEVYIPTNDQSYDLRQCRLLLRLLYVRFHALGGQDDSLLAVPCALAVAKVLVQQSNARDMAAKKNDIERLAWEVSASVQVVESLWAAFNGDWQSLCNSTLEVEPDGLAQYRRIFFCPHRPAVFAKALAWSVAVLHKTCNGHSRLAGLPLPPPEQHYAALAAKTLGGLRDAEHASASVLMSMWALCFLIPMQL